MYVTINKQLLAHYENNIEFIFLVETTHGNIIIFLQTFGCLLLGLANNISVDMGTSIDFTKPKSNMVHVYLSKIQIYHYAASHKYSLTKISVTNSGGHYLTISVWFIKGSFSPAPCVMSNFLRKGNFKYNCYPYMAIICKTYLHINCRDCDTDNDSLIFSHLFTTLIITFILPCFTIWIDACHHGIPIP